MNYVKEKKTKEKKQNHLLKKKPLRESQLANESCHHNCYGLKTIGIIRNKSDHLSTQL